MTIKTYLNFFFLIILISACEKQLIPSKENPSSKIVEHFYPKNEGPYKNPLKGWSSGWWDDHDYATVGFQYIKWKDFEPSNGEYNFNYVEDVIDRPGSRGRHLILRLYTDWHGEDEFSDAGPNWLYSELGIKRLRSDNGRYITDFNNEKFIVQAKEAINALAIHYDLDPRIYAFQIGIIGYWGEWHTYGYSEDYQLSNNLKHELLNSFKDNFKISKIMGRYPWKEPLSSDGGIGFHNDFFGPVDHSYEFDNAVSKGNKWLDGPIGGEYPPQIPENEFNLLYNSDIGESIIKKGHYSTMKVANVCEIESQFCESFMKLHRLMGYNFQIEKSKFPEIIMSNEELSIELEINNIGVAPIYYDWDVEFSILSNKNEVLKIFETDYIISTILPGDSFTLEIKNSNTNLELGTYKLGIRIVQPGAKQDKVNFWKLNPRNTYILFSNEIDVVDGYWDSSNALKGGWSILGDLLVK